MPWHANCKFIMLNSYYSNAGLILTGVGDGFQIRCGLKAEQFDSAYSAIVFYLFFELLLILSPKLFHPLTFCGTYSLIFG